jgi:hypothetical protein
VGVSKKVNQDVLGGKVGDRTHFIHCVLATRFAPLSPSRIGMLAERLARLDGRIPRPNTFSRKVTDSHLRSMAEGGLAERVGLGKWQLSQRARDLLTANGTA